MRGSLRWWIAAAGLALLVALALGWALRPARPAPVEATLSVPEILGDTRTEGYERAFEPRAFTFPADHGPHPGFRNEWWYFTGNLRQVGGARSGGAGQSGEERRFGFQLTFFRSRLAPPASRDRDGAAPRSSAWATDEIYMAHFALTDVAGERFRSAERFGRPVLELAGARAEPLRVWLEDWAVEEVPPPDDAMSEDTLPDDAVPAGLGAPESEASDRGATTPLTMRLRAARDGAAIDLTLVPAKPLVLQGEAGLSRKSAEPGNASYYYSFTRLHATGRVTSGQTAFEVEGSAWMDREWSTSALGQGQVGWDWFALQLADGWDLMYYQLRLADGGIDPASAGILVGPAGERQPLGQLAVEVLASWRSPETGATYPARWRLRAREAGIDLTLEPLLADQELRESLRYWEGAVRLSGTRGAAAVRGHGYVELTGY